MQMQLKLVLFALTLASGIALSGCGNKGGLYIPNSDPEATYTPDAQNTQQDDTAR